MRPLVSCVVAPVLAEFPAKFELSNPFFCVLQAGKEGTPTVTTATQEDGYFGKLYDMEPKRERPNVFLPSYCTRT